MEYNTLMFRIQDTNGKPVEGNCNYSRTESDALVLTSKTSDSKRFRCLAGISLDTLGCCRYGLRLVLFPTVGTVARKHTHTK